MRKLIGQETGKSETERKEKDILIEGAIKELVRNNTLGKLPGVYKDDPS